MARRIITQALQSRGAGGAPDTYFDRVVKYVPADIVAAWIAIVAAVKGAAETVPRNAVLWIAFLALIPFASLWTWRQTSQPGLRPAVTQVLVSTGAFVVWVFALGGPFESLSWYQPLYGSLLLIFYTLLVGAIIPREDTIVGQKDGHSGDAGRGSER
jgi:hypothetical protein